MRAYFSQFGALTRLRLSRNRRTGAPRHYAFLEFASTAVADVVAATMDGYLLSGRILRVRRVPAEQVHAELWRGAGRRFKRVPWGGVEGRGLRVGRERGVWEGRVARERGRRERKAEVLREYGYEFEVPRVKDVGEVPERAEREKVAEAAEGGGQGESAAAGEVELPATAGAKATGKKPKRAKGKKVAAVMD
jgi:nucleolar protein 15